jgi:Cu2+-exporting ATPase
VPAVLLVSIITLGVWLAVGAEVGFALARAVTVLVISCPCALGLATPVAIMVGSGVGARRGILFKNARALEAAARIKVVAFDKTGTVTEGQAEVSDIVGVSVSEDELMRLAIAIEEKSEHPLARAIVRYKENIDTVSLPDVNDFTAHVGGVSAEISGNIIFGGNRRFIEEKTQNMLDEKTAVRLDELSSQGKTALIFSTESKILGIVAVADKIKADAESAVRELNSMGIKTVMLTGDNKITAKYVAERVGFETVISEVLPADKARVLDELSEKYGSAAMVGDGINDSVALTKADVGIAVGRGADVAIDSADVVLTRGAISDVASAIKLSRRVLLNIWENLFWAFIYNIIGIPLAAGLFIAPFGWELDPMFGAAAMSISSFIVVVNALRLNLYNPSKIKNINNDMQRNIDKKDEITKMNTITIKIEGMMCPHCSGRVKAALEALDCVASAEVSHEAGLAIITLAKDCDEALLKQTVRDCGYKVVE